MLRFCVSLEVLRNLSFRVSSCLFDRLVGCFFSLVVAVPFCLALLAFVKYSLFLFLLNYVCFRCL